MVEHLLRVLGTQSLITITWKKKSYEWLTSGVFPLNICRPQLTEQRKLRTVQLVKDAVGPDVAVHS